MTHMAAQSKLYINSTTNEGIGPIQAWLITATTVTCIIYVYILIKCVLQKNGHDSPPACLPLPGHVFSRQASGLCLSTILSIAK